MLRVRERLAHRLQRPEAHFAEHFGRPFDSLDASPEVTPRGLPFPAPRKGYRDLQLCTITLDAQLHLDLGTCANAVHDLLPVRQGNSVQRKQRVAGLEPGRSRRPLGSISARTGGMAGRQGRPRDWIGSGSSTPLSQ